jgi:hypothetical protein
VRPQLLKDHGQVDASENALSYLHARSAADPDVIIPGQSCMNMQAEPASRGCAPYEQETTDILVSLYSGYLSAHAKLQAATELCVVADATDLGVHQWALLACHILRGVLMALHKIRLRHEVFDSQDSLSNKRRAAWVNISPLDCPDILQISKLSIVCEGIDKTAIIEGE